MDLVEVKKNEIYCDSGLIARKFEMQHAIVVRVMKNLIPKLPDYLTTGFNPKYKTEAREYRGTKYTAYLLNRDCFSLLAMKFDTKKARQWQGKFIAAFNTMENQILLADLNSKDTKWISTRNKGKIARIQETDVIKEFIDYAIAQGSKSAKFYYKHITNATYKALDLMVQRKPKLRDTLDLYEISELILAERLAKTSLKKYMDLGRDYKDIYESVKTDLLTFGSFLQLENKEGK